MNFADVTDKEIFELLPLSPEVGKKYYFFSNELSSKKLFLIKLKLESINKRLFDNFIDVGLDFGNRRKGITRHLDFRFSKKDDKLICDPDNFYDLNKFQLYELSFETKEDAILFLTKNLMETEAKEL